MIAGSTSLLLAENVMISYSLRPSLTGLVSSRHTTIGGNTFVYYVFWWLLPHHGNRYQ